VRKLRTVNSENSPLLPQRVKSGSVSGFALLTFSVRNHARSAFKRFSHPLPFAYPPRGFTREWREKSDWSKDIPECFLIIYLYKMEEYQKVNETGTDKKNSRISINRRFCGRRSRIIILVLDI